MALGDYRGPSSYLAFVRYVMAREDAKLRELSYRVYVTDMLQNIPQMKYLTGRWYDSVESKGGGDDGRSAEEIADDIVAGLSGSGL